MKIYKYFVGLAGILFLLFLTAPLVMAHRVTVFAWVDGDMVHTESKFSGGKRVRDGKISVYDTAGKLLLEGKTNTNGEFSFKIPQRTPMKIALLAGTGHRGEWLLTGADLGETVPDGEKAGAEKQPSESQPGEAPDTQSEQVSLSEPAEAVSPEMLQIAMEKALDKKLRPVMEILGRLSVPGPSLSDIFAGIGYIFGLMGVGAYVQFRRNKEKS